MPHRKPRGRHPKDRLTAAFVRRAPPGRHCDGNGLYLEVEPSLARHWLLRTVVAGRRREIGLGAVEIVSLAQARDEARRLRRMARHGGDPLAERRRARQSVPTLREATLAVHAAQSAHFRNAKHRAQWLSSLETAVLQPLGARPVNAIASGDLLRVLTPMWAATPETARRVKQRLRAVFEWAKAAGHLAGDNPAEAVTPALPKARRAARHFAALPYAEVPTCLAAVRALTTAAPEVRLAFEWLVLTAARTGEVIAARWDELDEAAATWTVPATRIKAGRTHRVPLAPEALAILTELRKLDLPHPFLFPGRRRLRRAPLSNMALLMLLRRAGYPGVTVHGFRSSFRDWAAERTTVPRDVCEAALAHVVPDRVEAAYKRTDFFELRRSLMATWAKFVTTAKGDVVTLRA